MSKTMKKKLGIIGLVVGIILVLIGNHIMNSQPHRTSEQKETTKEIEQEIANESDSITSKMESENMYQITLNNYLITLGRSTLGDVMANTGVLEDTMKTSEWQYRTVTKKYDGASDITEEIINEGYTRVSVMNDDVEELWFLVKAYSTEMPSDLKECVVWGVGVNSSTNYTLVNTELSKDSTYEELTAAFGSPIATTYNSGASVEENADAQNESATSETEKAQEPSAEEAQEEQPSEDAAAEETQNESATESSTWEAEWRTNLIGITVRQLENYRTIYVELL